MITDDSYLPGLQVMHYTLRKFSQRPLVILATNNIKRITELQIKKLSFIVLKKMNGISNPHEQVSKDEEGKQKPSWVGSGYTKLAIWSLTEYEKVFYIDADCLIKSSLESEFERKVEFAAAPDIFPPDRFNAGVLFIKPDMDIFKDMIQKIDQLGTYDGGDTGFLNAYYPNWYSQSPDHRLPFGYNAQRTMYWFTIKRTDGYWKEVERDDGLKIIHYSSSPKPWVGSPKGDLEMIWYQTYLEMLSSKK